jgi:hypothetical protein
LSARVAVASCAAVALCLGPVLRAAEDHPSRDAARDSARPPEYDPYRGMDRDGRIPKVRLPEDVRHPERWRYIPEGRIKPGNVFQRFLVSSFVTPIFYFEEAIGAGGGISLTDIDFREQRRREFAGLFAAHSTEGQERYSLVWQRWLAHQDLPLGGVIQEERTWVRGVVGYNRTLTRRFFGIGPDTPESAETSYTDESGYAQSLWQVSLPHPGDDVVGSLGLRWEHHNLARGHIRSRPSTEQAYPRLVADGDGNDSMWLSTGLRYDTRDSQHNPYRGWMLGAFIDSAPLETGGASGAVGEISGVAIMPVPGLFHHGGSGDEENPPTDVIAVGAFLQWTMGDLPFYHLPSLGGSDTLRGYIADRFTDRAAWHASVEYRMWAIPRGFAVTDTIRVERLGLAPFYELGTVAHRVSALREARIHDSYGVGLRAELERTAVFRCDLGWSREQFAVNVAYGLSF